MALIEYFDEVTTIRERAAEADADTDAVSIEYLVEGEDDDVDSGHRSPLDSEVVEGALVFIKGDCAVREFRAWAKSRGYLTDKPWIGGGA